MVVSPAMASRFLSELGQGADIGVASQAVEGLPAGVTLLTSREIEILHLLDRGLSNTEVTDTLLVSENTVKTHVKNILAKLHMKNRREAAAYAARLGFMQPEDEATAPDED